MRDARLLHLFADEALEKYAELNGQNLTLGMLGTGTGGLEESIGEMAEKKIRTTRD